LSKINYDLRICFFDELYRIRNILGVNLA